MGIDGRSALTSILFALRATRVSAQALAILVVALSLGGWGEELTLEQQVLMPIEDKVEMGHQLSVLVSQLQRDPIYHPLFENAFGDRQVTQDRIARALAQFIRSMVSFSSKYDQGRVQVQASGAKLSLAQDQLSAGDPASTRSGERHDSDRRDETRLPTTPARIGGTAEVDLRGLRVDEALDRLDVALDLAAAEGRDEVRLIHGIGTGALRSAVREHLPRSPYVIDVLEAAREEGGAGATRAILKKD